MSSKVWRLIVDGAGDGAWNMAADSALLDEVGRGASPPTLRLYGWRAPTVSLGRFQPLEQVDLELAEKRGVEVVRRPTGGRGVLHDDELTYSVVAGTTHGLPRGTAASYRLLCAGLGEAYRILGIDARVTQRPCCSRAGAACYLHVTRADLSFGTAKLSGSAQTWRGDTCLQHGSLVVSRDAAFEAALFRLPPEAASGLRERTATILEVTARRPSATDMVRAAEEGFSSVLGVRFERSTRTRRERAEAEASEGAFKPGRAG